jgi:hypothetical protein
MKSFKWLTELETYEMSSHKVSIGCVPCINHIGWMRLLPGITPAVSAAVRRRFLRCVTWKQDGDTGMITIYSLSQWWLWVNNKSPTPAVKKVALSMKWGMDLTGRGPQWCQVLGLINCIMLTFHKEPTAGYNPLRTISFPGFQEIFYFPTFSQCVVKLLTPMAYIFIKMINKTLINKFSSN